MRYNWKLRSVVWWLAAALVLACRLDSAQANAELEKLMQDPNYWVFPGGNYWNWRYSELKQINNQNAHKLQAAWTFSTGVLRGHEGGPLVLPGSATGLPHDTLYIHAAFPNNVFAINLDNLEIIWEYVPVQDYDETVPVMCCDTVNRGLGYGDGKILLQQADTTLVALGAKDGKLVWSVKNGDPKLGQTNTNAPHVMKDKVITGISGAEFGVRCWINAYDLNTGERIWRAYSVGPDDEILFDPQQTTELGAPVGRNSSLKTWSGDQWKIGGGSVWGWWPYDKELNSLYYGTGNPSTWNPVVRPGDNKWTMSIISRDVDTGMAHWVYQMTPHDEWDYDGINEMILVDMKVKGKDTKALVHFDRNGFGYTLDRTNGALLVAEKFDPAVNWATHIDMKTGRPQVVAQYSTHAQGENVNTTNICPAALGTKDQQPAAYSPRTGLFYVPTNHVCMDYEPVSRGEYVAGQPYVNAVLSMFPAGRVSPGPEFGNNADNNNLGNFIAWDADKGKIVWSIPERFSVWSGALATAGDVVFYGTLDGYLKTIDAKSGKLLWKFKTPSGIIGNVNTWGHGGKQYVGILSGVGGWAGIGMAAGLINDTDGLGAVGAYKGLNSYTRLGGVLSVFSLDDGEGQVVALQLPLPPPNRKGTLEASELGNPATLGEARSRLARMANEAGFSDPVYYALSNVSNELVDDGFAMVLSPEAIDANGHRIAFHPLGKTISPTGLLDYVTRLFSAESGRWRMIVFIVTDETWVDEGSLEINGAVQLSRAGSPLTKFLATETPFTGKHACFVYMYEFRKLEYKAAAEIVDPVSTVSDALSDAGILKNRH